MAIEIKLTGGASIIQAQNALVGIAEEMKKPEYKDKVLSILDYEAWKSNKQNSAFHGLIGIFWRSGCCSENSYDNLRNGYKRKIGLIDYYVYIDSEMKIKKADNIKDIPLSKNELSTRARIILRSFSNATKKQVKQAIDFVIQDCLASGVNTSKCAKEFEEVLSGMEKDKIWNKEAESYFNNN